MAYFEITRVYADGPDRDRTIDAVSGPGFHHTISQAVTRILQYGDRYTVMANGRMVAVKAHYRYETERWYLATEPDGILLNNLSHLARR